jgi:glycosyltransferase involved in cell wall biosynthesis
VSVIVPAYNEEKYLQPTLLSLQSAAATLAATSAVKTQLIVVDDGSTDATAAIAEAFADVVVAGVRGGIGTARNRGAAVACGDLLVFIDADTTVDPSALVAIYSEWQAGARVGAIAPYYTSDRLLLHAHFAFWRWYARRHQMTQGVCQFIDRQLFTELGGYRSDLYMAEDTDFYHRAIAQLKTRGEDQRRAVIASPLISPSLRRFEHWSTWRVLFWTNPWLTKCARWSRSLWRHWYDNPPR